MERADIFAMILALWNHIFAICSWAGWLLNFPKRGYWELIRLGFAHDLRLIHEQGGFSIFPKRDIGSWLRGMGFAHDLSSAKPFQLHMLSEQNECETNWQRRICFDKRIEPNSTKNLSTNSCAHFMLQVSVSNACFPRPAPICSHADNTPDIGAERKKRCHSATVSESSYNAICLIIIDILKIWAVSLIFFAPAELPT